MILSLRDIPGQRCLTPSAAETLPTASGQA